MYLSAPPSQIDTSGAIVDVAPSYGADSMSVDIRGATPPAMTSIPTWVWIVAALAIAYLIYQMGKRDVR